LKFLLTKRHCIIIIDKPFSSSSLQLAIEQISLGIENYKDYLLKKWYKKPYVELSNDLKIEIDNLNNTRMSFFDFSYLNGKRLIPPLPPPPPKFDFNDEDAEEV